MLVDGNAIAGGRLRIAIATGACVALLGPGTGAIALGGDPHQPPTRRACGGVQKSFPSENRTRGRAPLAIGDSPMLLAMAELARVGYRANARGCRQYDEGLDVLRDYKRRDHLAPVVTIALGANGSVTKDDIHDALEIVGKRRKLVLVTPREVGGGESSDAEVIRHEAREHPRRTALLDWVKHSAGHSGWFQSDGLHLTEAGAEAFAQFLKKPLRHLRPPGRVLRARRACGSAEKTYPKKNVSRGRAPLAIGDSPMVLALPDLAEVGYRANGRECRFYPEGLDVVREYKRRGRLGSLVTLALGSNGTVTRENVHDALDIVGRRRTLALVTPRETGGGESGDADVVRREASEHRNRIVLLDWVRYSAGHSSWFQADGLHLTFEGAEAMARLFKRPVKDLPPPLDH